MTEERKVSKAVFTIVEKPALDRPLWIRVGTAFVNRDGSMNVQLDATPTNGKLHIRDRQPDNKAKDSAALYEVSNEPSLDDRAADPGYQRAG